MRRPKAWPWDPALRSAAQIRDGGGHITVAGRGLGGRSNYETLLVAAACIVFVFVLILVVIAIIVVIGAAVVVIR